MKNETINKVTKREENRWIDVHDDNIMHEMGLVRQPLRIPRDKSVWTKTPNERRILRNVKCSNKLNMHFHSVPLKQGTVRAKLVVQLKHNKKFNKSTYSFICLDTEINSILSQFQVSSKSVIKRYSYDGRTLYNI